MSKTTPGSPVMVNATVQLTENAEHLRSSVKQDIQKQLTGALQRRNNNVGTSGLWVDSPAGAISQLHGMMTNNLLVIMYVFKNTYLTQKI